LDLHNRHVTVPAVSQSDPVDGAELRFLVTDGDTALALGSGSVPALATPRLIAWLEAATMAALSGELTPGTTSVGARVDVEHLRPSPVGASVVVGARVIERADRRVRLAVWAEQAAPGGAVRIASGTVERVVVDTARFLAGLG